MRASEIREMSVEDITKRVAELEEERFRLRFRGATEALEDPLRLRGLRRDVARLKTILRERAIEGGAPRRGRRAAVDTNAATPAGRAPGAR